MIVEKCWCLLAKDRHEGTRHQLGSLMLQADASPKISAPWWTYIMLILPTLNLSGLCECVAISLL